MLRARRRHCTEQLLNAEQISVRWVLMAKASPAAWKCTNEDCRIDNVSLDSGVKECRLEMACTLEATEGRLHFDMTTSWISTTADSSHVQLLNCLISQCASEAACELAAGSAAHSATHLWNAQLRTRCMAFGKIKVVI